MESFEQSVRRLVRDEFPHLEVRRARNDSLEIVGVDASVGSMFLDIAPEEITLYVGPTHAHFVEYPDEGPERADAAGALAFVREVLADRIVLWSCLGAGGAYPLSRGRRRVPWPVRRSTWSGPIRQ